MHYPLPSAYQYAYDAAMGNVLEFPHKQVLGFTQEMIRALDRETKRRRLPSRSATIRKLIEEALEKAK